jgi:DNA-binding transcriptional LysR family regulator
MLNEIDLSRADLNLLVLFDVVLAEQHVGRAAQRLHLTPSAASHGLGRLRRLLNDPLFLRTPKGVVPTERAVQLAGPVADLLARARNVLSIAEPFDPARSLRQFKIGAPDGVSAVFLPQLLARLRDTAPGIDVRLRQLLPRPGESTPDSAWQAAFAELEARAMDIAVMPFGDIPARFHARVLFDEDFVVAMRATHPLVRSLSLDQYCSAQHLVVSDSGDARGFVDKVLAEQGRERRVALTVPSFLFAVSVIAETELICALPRHFAALHAARFGVVTLDAPLPLGRFRINAVASKAAMMDAGLAWLFEMLPRTDDSKAKRRPARVSR